MCNFWAKRGHIAPPPGREFRSKGKKCTLRLENFYLHPPLGLELCTDTSVTDTRSVTGSDPHSYTFFDPHSLNLTNTYVFFINCFRYIHVANLHNTAFLKPIDRSTSYFHQMITIFVLCSVSMRSGKTYCNAGFHLPVPLARVHVGLYMAMWG